MHFDTMSPHQRSPYSEMATRLSCCMFSTHPLFDVGLSVAWVCTCSSEHNLHTYHTWYQKGVSKPRCCPVDATFTTNENVRSIGQT